MPFSNLVPVLPPLLPRELWDTCLLVGEGTEGQPEALFTSSVTSSPLPTLHLRGKMLHLLSPRRKPDAVT